MAGQVAIIEDSSALSRVDLLLLKLERFCAFISGLTIFSLMFLAVYSVSGRKFFNSPLAGYVDYIEAALPIIAIMGVSYVQRVAVIYAWIFLFLSLKAEHFGFLS